MTESHGNPVKSRVHDLKTADLKLGNGWSARVALNDSAGNQFSPDEWESCLADPQSLYDDPKKIIKDDGTNLVIVRQIKLGDKKLNAHIKIRRIGNSFRDFCRAVLPAKAFRNFNTSQKLCSNNIPTARPLAALQKKKFFLTTWSFYITEYAQDSLNLYEYLRNCDPCQNPLKVESKKKLIRQFANIFANMHRASLWHRDAKASNFLVTEVNSENECKIILIDMDGIKPYRFRKHYSRFYPFAKLTASVLWHPQIRLTDYMRTFKIYSNLTGLEPIKQRLMFEELIRQTEAIRLISLVKNIRKKRIPKRILIIKPSALGDIVLAMPALSSLRANFPNARISWLIRNEFAPLIENNKHLDEIILFDRKLLGKWYYNPKAFTALIRFIAELRKPKFDLVLDLQGLFRTALFARFTGSKKRFGMKTSRECAHLFYTHRVSPPPGSHHVVDYYNAIVAAVGAKVIKTDFDLTCDQNAELQILSILEDQNLQPRKYAVFIPGSAHISKCWPTKYFAALADKIYERFGLTIILVGTAREKQIVNQVGSLASTPVIDFVGKTDIPKLIALLKNALIVVSNDTGPGHIAAAMDVPLVMIFGPTNPARVGPYKKPQTVAAIDPQDRGPQIESNDPKHKIDDVSLDFVLQKVLGQIKSDSL